MPGWSFPLQLPPVISRSITGGSFFESSFSVPSSRFVPWSSVYLSSLIVHVQSAPTGLPNWIQDSIFHSPSSFFRSALSSLGATFGAGAAVTKPAKHVSPTANRTRRIIGDLHGRAGPLYHPPAGPGD